MTYGIWFKGYNESEAEVSPGWVKHCYCEVKCDCVPVLFDTESSAQVQIDNSYDLEIQDNYSVREYIKGDNNG